MSAGIVIVLLLLTLAAPIIAPYGYSHQDIAARLSAPSSTHLLGTDNLGRDVLSRIIGGVRIAMLVGLPSILIACACGITLGMFAAFLGGWADAAAVVVMDTLQVFPAVVLALLVMALLGPSLVNLLIVISIAFIPNYARVTRALVLSTNASLFMEAERALGAGRARIVIHHLLPNIITPIIVLMAMDIPFAIVAESGLSFLGLGVRPPAPSWGAVLAEGFEFVQISPWPVLAASACLVLTTLGLTLLAERLREMLDPGESLEQIASRSSK